MLSSLIFATSRIIACLDIAAADAVHCTSPIPYSAVKDMVLV